MNAYVSKQEMAYRMPESLSHYFKDEVPYMPQPEPQGISLFARIGAGLRRLAQLPARRAVINELQTLSDHELADIGISRAEVSRVFDPAFTASRSAERFGRNNATGYICFG